MNVTLLCVGRLREKYWSDACAEYLKRLSRYGRTEVIEVPDLPEIKNASEADNRKVMDREAAALMKYVRGDDRVICMCVNAPQWDSPALAEKVKSADLAGRRLVFVIGGSLGLGEEILRRADEKVSMGRMTFPHQLARVMLLEQLYRSAKINSGERYHK